MENQKYLRNKEAEVIQTLQKYKNVVSAQMCKSCVNSAGFF